MTSHEYVAHWPILDPDLRLADVVTAAMPDLAAMMRRDGARSAGIPSWWASEHAGVPFLNVSVPAEPVGRHHQ